MDIKAIDQLGILVQCIYIYYKEYLVIIKKILFHQVILIIILAILFVYLKNGGILLKEFNPKK